MFIGLILVVVGVIALLVRLGVLTGSVWSYTWPVLLIVLGLLFVFGRGRGWGCCGWRRWHYPPDDEEKK